MSSEIVTALPYTLELAVVAIVLALLVGCTLGLLAAMRRGELVDSALSGVSVLGVSMPVYWAGLLLVILFSAHSLGRR